MWDEDISSMSYLRWTRWLIGEAQTRLERKQEEEEAAGQSREIQSAWADSLLGAHVIM